MNAVVCRLHGGRCQVERALACLEGPFFGETLASIRPCHSKERNHHTHNAMCRESRRSLQSIDYLLELESSAKPMFSGAERSVIAEAMIVEEIELASKIDHQCQQWKSIG